MITITLDDKPEIIMGLISKSLDGIIEKIEDKDYDVAHFQIFQLKDSVDNVFERMGGADKVRSYLNEDITKE